jgi:hypothetical protein
MVYGVLGSKIKLENGKGVQVKKNSIVVSGHETTFNVI